MIRAAIILSLATVSACGTTRTAVIDRPREVEVQHVVYRPIPADLLAPCLLSAWQGETGSDLVGLTDADIAELDACNERLARARELNGNAVEGG